MRIAVLSDDEAFVRALAEAGPPVHEAKVFAPSLVAGVDASWWQLMVDFGMVSLPVGVVGNLIASWLWQSLHGARKSDITTLNLSPQHRVKIVMRRAEHDPIEIEIASDDLEAIRLSVDAALERGYKQ